MRKKLTLITALLLVVMCLSACSSVKVCAWVRNISPQKNTSYQIVPEDITMISIPKEELDDSYFTDKNKVIGQYLYNRSVKEGDIVLDQSIREFPINSYK